MFWTDFFQSFLLWFGGFAILVLIIMNVDGGLGTILSVAAACGKFMLGDLNTATGELVRAPWGFGLTEKTVVMMLLVGLTGWLTEYSSNQNVIQQCVATKNPKQATQAIRLLPVQRADLGVLHVPGQKSFRSPLPRREAPHLHAWRLAA